MRIRPSIIGAAIHELVSREELPDVAAGVRRIVDLCALDVVHPDWELVRFIDFAGEVAALKEWFQGTLLSDSPSAPLRALCFSLSNLITESGEVTLDLGVVGTADYNASDRGLQWLFNCNYFPDAYAQSSALHRLYGVAYGTHAPGVSVAGALGNDCEWPVGLAYAVLATRAMLEGCTVADLYTDVACVGVVAGWAEGDLLLIGEISERGFSPVAMRRM